MALLPFLEGPPIDEDRNNVDNSNIINIDGEGNSDSAFNDINNNNNRNVINDSVQPKE